MSLDPLDCYLKAGRIASQIRREMRQVRLEGESVLAICTRVEERIRQLGGAPAFPCNVGINEVAAHYTARLEDATTVPAGSIVKVDFGVAVDGYIADTAYSYTANPQLLTMVAASKEALAQAIRAFKPGSRLGEVGAAIHRAVQGFGFQPIQNLSGHKMERYTLHAGKSVPNVAADTGGRLEPGEVYAIEPFVTTLDGAGRVVEGADAYIYRFVKEKGARSSGEKDLVREIRERFRTLPFTVRWLADRAVEKNFHAVFERLLSAGNVEAYPVLREGWGRPVAQSEHTVVVTESGCRVLTA